MPNFFTSMGGLFDFWWASRSEGGGQVESKCLLDMDSTHSPIKTNQIHGLPLMCGSFQYTLKYISYTESIFFQFIVIFSVKIQIATK